MKKQLLILIALFISVIGYSQTVGDTFVDTYITYEVTSVSPNEVEVINYNISGGTDVIIPAAVTPSSSGRTASRMVTYDVTSIGVNAFYTKGITSVDIPNSIIHIGTQAFAVNYITTAIIGNSVTNIGHSAFYNNNLTSVIIPDSVTTLDSRAFDDNLLTSIIIPSNITSIGFAAFRDNLITCVTSEATTPPTITTESSINDTFSANRSGLDLIIPTGTGSAYATATWTGFNSVTESDFSNVFVVDHITYQITSATNNTVTAIDYDTAGGTIVNIPATVSRACVIYSVTSTGNNSFSNNNLTSITIPNSITTISYSSFANNNLMSVVIPDSVETIGQTAFAYNNNMNSLDLGNNVTSIGESAFAFCDLPSAIIPDSVITIDEGAFAQNNNMTSVSIGNNVTSIGDYTFRFNNLNSVTIPNSVTSIGDLAFSSNTINTLVLGNGLTNLNEDVFSYNNLTSVVIPNTIINIDAKAFLQNNLTSLIIPDNVASIGELAFAGNAITNLIIGNSVTNIGIGAFNTNQLTSITIPENVANIGDNAFYNNNPLTDIYSEGLTPANITTGGIQDTFSQNRGIIHLHIPAGTMGAYVTDAGALWTGFSPVTEDALSVDDYELAKDVKIVTTTDAIEVITANNERLQNYVLYSISGAKITTGTDNEIATSSFAKGIYILKLEFVRGTVVKKVVIK